MPNRCVATAFILTLAAAAAGDFGIPGETNVRERIAGEFRATDGAPVPEAGDQIGVFFGTQIIGRFVVETDGEREFEVLVFGDDPDTTTVEGPRRNQPIRFRFFDVSTNQTIDLTALNRDGEAFNLTFQGEEVPPLPIPLPGLDLTPTREFNLRVATADDDDDDDGGGSSGNRYDVDANGRVETEDAAIVLRIVTGGAAAVPVEQRRRADVTGDGKVTTGDAVEILRNR